MNNKQRITPQLIYWLFGAGFAVILIAICAKMILMITGEEGEKWRKVGQTLHRPEPIMLEPIRGSIYASDGRPVAITAPSYRLYLDFNAGALRLAHNDKLQMPKDSLLRVKRKALQDKLSHELDELQARLDSLYGSKVKSQRERWRKAYQKKNRYCLIAPIDISYLDLKLLLSQTPFANRYENGRLKEKSLLKQMLITEERSKRINPFGSLALRTIGSVYAEKKDGLSQGKQGLELHYDSLLRGQIGEGVKRYNAQRYNLKVLTAPKPGMNIYTTLDMNKQNLLEGIMRAQLGKFRAGSGSAVLMEVKTGKILAITNLQRDAQGDYQETINYAASDMSEPGSTFKVASMMVALDDGIVSPTDTIDVGNGGWTVGKRLLRDHNYGRGYGRISASQVIERSSNVGVAKIIVKGYANRPDDYVQKIRDLGFGLDLKLEIPGAARARVRKKSDNPNRWYGTTLAWMSFGYETQIPPIYTLAFFNAIANGGKLMRPYMVTQIRDDEGEVIEQQEPTVLKESICKPSTLTALQDMLRKVVTDGTGRSLRTDVVAISGKSGTAQIAQGGSYSGPDGKTHQVSFCGYFPSEAPRYSMIVVIRNPSKEFAAGGGSMAGPVIRDLAERLISMETPRSLDSIPTPKDIQPRMAVASGRKEALQALLQQVDERYQADGEISEEEYIHIDAERRERKLPKASAGTIPNVVGQSATDATHTLLSRGYIPRFSGSGRVVSQSIPAGSKAKQGTKINITLGQ
ncbi:MAG: penicillin-binding transpeptidase domain-containing protein [Porphyromonadaceae bacterium]|nr:penicillin-binding transpeptidase domain-containing protein [Porphyromonadaceae bacterium]